MSLRRVVGVIISTAVAAVLAVACATPTVLGTAPVYELWQDPGDIAARDLRWGRGGQALAPSEGVAYEFKALDVVGHSAGYDVIDPQGREWDVKTGDEAQPEVVANRVLWAVGYHQPTVYFVADWTLKNGPVATPLAGRFRLESDHESIGRWSWSDNPFRGTRQLHGLIAANLIINNWDFKTSNNSIFSVPSPAGRERWFVTQDIGASFGKTGWPIGSRNRIADYEAQGFIAGVAEGRVQFDYHGRHLDLLVDITPADVVWISNLFSRITDRQWSDVFEAGGMSAELGGRYTRHIKSKIQEGLSLRSYSPPQ